jgi:glycogen debranching enzyme
VEARELRARIEDRFWMEDEAMYALALDGEKQPVRSIASNAGHVLWCGVPSAERARRVGTRLLADDLASGYGLRTLSAEHRRYNPLSYQLGSVWPHDTALCASGLARYGLREEAARLIRAMLDAATAFELARLPELFCGFSRAHGPPVPYEKPTARRPGRRPRRSSRRRSSSGSSPTRRIVALPRAVAA